MRKTLRELELEHEVTQLKLKIMEMHHRSEAVLARDSMFSVSSVEPRELPTLPENLVLPMRALATCEYDTTSNGWRVDAWCYGDRKLRYAYYMQHPIQDRDAPYVLDQMHEQFQYAMLQHITGKKTEAA